jgi:hypothetical protein
MSTVPNPVAAALAPPGPSGVGVPDPTRAPMEALRAKLNGDPPPAAAKADDKPKIEIDPATLKARVKGERELREARERIKQLEPVEARLKELEPLAEAKKLYGEGKKLEAIALLSGADATAEMEALLEKYLEADDGTPPKDDVQKRLDAIDEKLKAEEKAKADAAEQAKKDAEQAKTAAFEQARKNGVTYASSVAAKHADKFELSSRPKHRDEAAQAALDGVVFLASEREIDLEKLSTEDTEKLFVEAYTAVEADLEEKAKEEIAAWTKAPKAAPPPAAAQPRAPAPPPVDRAAVSTMPAIGEGPTTPDAVLARARARMHEKLRSGS